MVFLHVEDGGPCLARSNWQNLLSALSRDPHRGHRIFAQVRDTCRASTVESG